MPGNRATVGSVEVISFSDGRMVFPFANAFPTVTAAAWGPYKQRFPDAVTPQGDWHNNCGCFAVRSGGRTVMVDTGLGPGPIQAMGGFRGKLVDELRSNGVKLEDVDLVVITHLHLDHVGWNLTTRQGKPAPLFPKARYIVSQADWDAFTKGELAKQPHIQQEVLPLRELGILELVKGEHQVTPDIRTLPTPGHTPGHQSVLIASAGQRAIITGDVVLHPAQVTEVGWSVGFDMDPPAAARSRQQVMERAQREQMQVFAGHFPPPSLGKLIILQGKRYWQAS